MLNTPITLVDVEKNIPLENLIYKSTILLIKASGFQKENHTPLKKTKWFYFQKKSSYIM